MKSQFFKGFNWNLKSGMRKALKDLLFFGPLIGLVFFKFDALNCVFSDKIPK
jgi:hypothetical protein